MEGSPRRPQFLRRLSPHTQQTRLARTHAPPFPTRQVPTVIVQETKHAVPRADTRVVEGRDVWWEDAVAGQPTEAEVEWVEADHPLFLLYTSGSTGAREGRV